MDEATALLLTLESTDPRAPTACADWTAHQLVAHLAAGAAEMAGHAERALSGEPEQATRGFAEREAPFVAMEDPELRDRLFAEALRLNAAVDALSERGLSVAFSGRRLSAREIRTHGRSEAALHRWDLCGDDEFGDQVLGQPELTTHAVTVLNSMLADSSESPETRACKADISGPTRFVLGSPGQLDVVVTVDQWGARLELGAISESPTATCDPSTRLLALWGRRSPNRTIEWNADDPACWHLARFLWGPTASVGEGRAAASIS
jgi:hypothetical protein